MKCFVHLTKKVPSGLSSGVKRKLQRILSKTDGCNVRHSVTDSWSLYRIHVNWYWHIYALLASLAYFCNSFACSSKPWTCFFSVAKFYVSMSAVINHVSVSQTKTKVQSIWFPSRKLVWFFYRTTPGPCVTLLSFLEESCLMQDSC